MNAVVDTSASLPGSVDAVARELEEDIVLGTLQPKVRLIEDDLMVRFDVRRHIVRAALAKLAHMGLVEHRKNIGALVRSYERAEVFDLYGVRELLEGQAAALIPCPPGADALRDLESLQRLHDQAVSAHDARATFRTNMAFHAALFALCPNKVLVGAIDYYARQTHAIRFGSAGSSHTQARSRAEHHAILDALRSGRRDELVRLCKEHIMPSRDEYLASKNV